MVQFIYMIIPIILLTNACNAWRQFKVFIQTHKKNDNNYTQKQVT